jgi:hypothetical protein
MPARFIGRQPNLINNNLIRETLFINNSVSVFPLRGLSQVPPWVLLNVGLVVDCFCI